MRAMGICGKGSSRKKYNYAEDAVKSFDASVEICAPVTDLLLLVGSRHLRWCSCRCSPIHQDPSGLI